jgi:acetoin utilization protein AcuB
MRLRDIMSQNIKTIGPATSVEEARAAMKSNRIHHLLVREGGDIVGVLSDRDLGRGSGAQDRRRVADVMTTNVITATADTTIRQAANLFRGRTIGCLPILDADKPVGIVTTTDLLELLGRGAERPVERTTRWTLRDRGPRRVGPSARGARRG